MRLSLIAAFLSAVLCWCSPAFAQLDYMPQVDDMSTVAIGPTSPLGIDSSSSVAGTGIPGYSGDGGQATSAMLGKAISLALDAVPEGIDAAAVRAHLAAMPGVAAIHDLHIWGMSTTETAMTCHLVMPGGHPGDAALGRLARELDERFGIHHATIQIELADSDEVCVLTPEHVV